MKTKNINFLKIGGVSFAVICFLLTQFSQAGALDVRSAVPMAGPYPNPTPFQTPKPTPTPAATATVAAAPSGNLSFDNLDEDNPCKKFYVKATSYNLTESDTFTKTKPGLGTIAVDPKFIALGSVITVPGYGQGIARDTGTAVKGLHIDVWLPGWKANEWGVKWLEVEVCPPIH